MFENGIIRPDPLTNKPIELWKRYLRQGRVSEPVKTLRIHKPGHLRTPHGGTHRVIQKDDYKLEDAVITLEIPFGGLCRYLLNAPINENKVRFVCISDTHGKLDEIVDMVPDGDVLIHAGDFTNYGDVSEVINFNQAMGMLPHKHKIVIAGNHELGFEDGEEMTVQQLAGLNMLGINKAYELLTNCTYLCDRQIELYGLKIYGTPWHPMPGYSFFRDRGAALLQKWDRIPNKVDVLITHTPPLGHGDFNAWNKLDGILAGCAELLNTVEYRVKPKYHVFGHVHQRHGATTNGKTTFINASICDHKLNTIYPPIIFDVALPYGQVKENVLE